MLNVLIYTYTRALKAKWFIIMLLAGVLVIAAIFNMDKISKMFGEESEQVIALYDMKNSISLDQFTQSIELDSVVFKNLQSAEEVEQVIGDMGGKESQYVAAIIFNGTDEHTDIYVSGGAAHETVDSIVLGAQKFTLYIIANNLNLPTETTEKFYGDDNLNIIQIGEGNSDHSVVIIVMVFILYLIVLLYGSLISNSIVEEKSNRIMETLLCASNPKALLFGKVIGMFLASITQICVWVGTAFFMLKVMPNSVMANWGLTLNTKVLIYLVLFSMLGYLMYAMVFAALGSLVDNAQDATQMQLPIMLILVLVYAFTMIAIDKPDSLLIMVLSYLPFSAPIIGFARFVLLDLAWYSVALNVVVQLVYIIIIGLVSSNIYKKGVVSYGKVPAFIKWYKKRK